MSEYRRQFNLLFRKEMERYGKFMGGIGVTAAGITAFPTLLDGTYRGLERMNLDSLHWRFDTPNVVDFTASNMWFHHLASSIPVLGSVASGLVDHSNIVLNRVEAIPGWGNPALEFGLNLIGSLLAIGVGLTPIVKLMLNVAKSPRYK